MEQHTTIMNAFAECQEQKDRVKACYGDWFQKLWGGSYDRHSCEQETEDYRQCVQDVLKRNKDQGKRSWKNSDNDWMDRVKDQSNDAAEEATGRARQTRDRVRDKSNNVADEVKGRTRNVRDKVKDKSNNVAEEVKGRARNARDRAIDGKEEAESKLRSTASNVTSKVQETADSWADKIKGFAKKADNKAQHTYDDDDD
ncbi:Mitochondrial distribution/morphology family 35/apoptosis [Plasmopara halstedii]|uniref:Mitochondrial distribution/morphology family 35/apoptosis n=1 Tax=Plasmopara halstedii TaxID=4781 RepID=A0A0P1AN95_PLAHL|nr:Mitochondrial distribution/morphology family 35/apoptosis [Plasmopara halstedii]CEG42612.1 Mitochondrial distribution/morphology family 35/apoptosis [Plasmopara halstedii]|eukprot:XP_024578981.1 Mitochondrial distribution/morphology family 35/apoptosis [Plasmopara halstedii]